MLVEITSVELTHDTIVFVGHEVGSKTKRRIPLEHIKELVEFNESKPMKKGLIERRIEAKERGLVWNGLKWEKPNTSIQRDPYPYDSNETLQ
jgi:hypothetical protein